MSDTIILTKEGFKKAKQELDRYEKEIMPAIAQRIASARAHGDLSENAEYHAAREEQGIINGKILDLKTLLKNAQVIEKKASDGIVRIGSIITISTKDKEYTYTIVGANESDPSNGKISCDSPLAKTFLEHKEGEDVEFIGPNGSVMYNIRKVI